MDHEEAQGGRCGDNWSDRVVELVGQRMTGKRRNGERCVVGDESCNCEVDFHRKLYSNSARRKGNCVGRGSPTGRIDWWTKRTDVVRMEWYGTKQMTYCFRKETH